jgi:hypothetical protein
MYVRTDGRLPQPPPELPESHQAVEMVGSRRQRHQRSPEGCTTARFVTARGGKRVVCRRWSEQFLTHRLVHAWDLRPNHAGPGLSTLPTALSSSQHGN